MFDPQREFWRDYRSRLQQALGPDADEPRLEWAARHIVEQSNELAARISDVGSSLQRVIKSHQRNARLIGQWGVMLTLVASALRSEEHTSELQSLMRISYAVFCLKKKKYKTENTQDES